MMTDRNFRGSPVGLECRGLPSVTLGSSGRSLIGYAAVFNEETRIADFREVIKPGAFGGLDGKDVLCLCDHDASKVLGRTRSGTLRLEQDSKGLRFELSLPDTTIANNVLALALRGDLGGCSFAFSVPPNGEKWEGKRRELRSVVLHEISIVSAWPAYKGTSVSARMKSSTPRLDNLQRWAVALC